MSFFVSCEKEVYLKDDLLDLKYLLMVLTETPAMRAVFSRVSPDLTRMAAFTKARELTLSFFMLYLLLKYFSKSLEMVNQGFYFHLWDGFFEGRNMHF